MPEVMNRQIVLLRGINVGGHRRVAMADLRALLQDAGYGEVATLGQSGNVVLSAELEPERLGAQLEGQIEEGLGVQAKIVVRTRAQLAAVVAYDPLGEIAEDMKRYQVSFLSAAPTAEAMSKLATVDVAPERWVHRDREIYAWHPVGVHSSPLAKLLTDRRLGVTATARNWNTVTKLLEMVGSAAS
jgi:uncharacterized protein (DUF1697 family)